MKSIRTVRYSHHHLLLLHLSLIFTLLSSFANGQNMLDRLDLSSGSIPRVAYGVRELSTSYTGSAMKVQRSTDFATQDIGFTPGGDLDTASLKAFVGSGNGYLDVWYDQSGNGVNLIQTQKTPEPWIVNAGVIYRQNGQPFISFFGTVGSSNSDYLKLPSQMSGVQEVSAVVRFLGDGFLLGSSTYVNWHSSPGATLFRSDVASPYVLTGTGMMNKVSYAAASDMPYPAILSAVDVVSAAPQTNMEWDNIGMDRSLEHNTNAGGGYAELIIFSSPITSAERIAMQANQDVYYSLSATLPVSFTRFTAALQGKQQVLLQWSAADATNVIRYAVQHSNDGLQWTEIGSTSAAQSHNADYAFTDISPKPGNNYYRIAELDFDGKPTFSPIRQLKLGSTAPAFSINQNPVHNRLSCKVDATTVISLINADGNLIWTRQFSPGIHTIDISNCSPGMYLLKSATKSEKLMIQ